MKLSGAARAGVIQQFGAPRTAVHALPNGERLQYSRPPFDTQAHNLEPHHREFV